MEKITSAHDSAREQVLAQVLHNQAAISGLHAENMRLMASVPGLLSADYLTREEKLSFADFNFRADEMTQDVLAPAMVRHRHKGDGMPAYLSVPEAQMIFGYRFIANAAFGSLLVEVHEKKRVSICATLRGR
ncbi:MAG: hypothetical protein ACRYFS_24485 [Janthinobacterium lividum]